MMGDRSMEVEKEAGVTEGRLRCSALRAPRMTSRVGILRLKNDHQTTRACMRGILVADVSDKTK